MNIFTSFQGGRLSSTGLRMLWQKNRGRIMMWPKRLILHHTLAFDVIILLIGAIGTSVVIFTSLYVEPVLNSQAVSQSQTLNVDMIDALELWLEEFHTEHERSLQIDSTVFFRAAATPLTP